MLYAATQHAREWIATEVNRRLLHHFVDNYGKQRRGHQPGRHPRAVVRASSPTRTATSTPSTPSGCGARTCATTTATAQITIGDGVDPNRNFDEHWNYDNEGSSTEIVERDLPRQPRRLRAGDAGACRGCSTGSTSSSWSTTTPTASCCSTASAGRCRRPPPTTRSSSRCRAPTPTPRSPASTRASAPISTRPTARRPTTRTPRPARSPGRLSWARASRATASSSPTTRRWSSRSSRSTCRSRSTSPSPRPNPAQPVSHLGNTTKPFYRRRLRRSRTATRSTRAGQCARAQPRRGHAEVSDQRRRGAERADHGVERRRALRRPRRRLLPHRCAARSPARSPATGEGRGSRAAARSATRSPTRREVESDGARAGRRGRGLHRHLAGVQARRTGRATSRYYPDALAANGIAADVYDVDANGRQAPDALGVLEPLRRGHLVHRRRRHHPRAGHGARHRVAAGQRRDARRAQLTSTRAAGCSTPASTPASSSVRVRVRPGGQRAVQPGRRRDDGCLALADDFLQYYLGAYLYNDEAGHDAATASCYDVIGADNPFAGSSWTFGGAEREQPGPQRVVHRDQRHPAGGDVPAVHQLGVGEVRPAGRAVRRRTPAATTSTRRSPTSRYKRLTRTIDLTGAGERQPVVLDLARHRAGLGLRRSSRRTPSGRTTGRRCPTATGTPSTRDRRQLPRRLARAAPVPRPLPDVNADGTCSPTGTTGVVERRQRATRAAGSSGRRPVGLRRQAGRGLDRLRQRLVGPGTGRVRRRHRGLDRRVDLVRDRASAAGA